MWLGNRGRFTEPLAPAFAYDFKGWYIALLSIEKGSSGGVEMHARYKIMQFNVVGHLLSIITFAPLQRQINYLHYLP